MVILHHGTLLQEEFAACVEDEDVHRAMFQSLAVDFTARELADHLVALVYYIENLVVHAVLYNG
ncbi:MAG TPA: hypothetical protein VM735_08155, partial [Candidatus Kapabacteria bacterium]|nr:hypothetical protein [Candidatus Kapabacteria bacterium]